MLDERTFESEGYRYGFNGMEKDDELKGTGNHVDFGARGYDPRLGRWLSVDPSFARYPNLSPYNFGFNSPIRYQDPDGRDPREGNEVLSVNFGRCYITKIYDEGASFNTNDIPLRTRAFDFQEHGIGPSFSPLVNSPKILEKVYETVEYYGHTKEAIDAMMGTTANEQLRNWQVAAKSASGYEYIEIDIATQQMTTRTVKDAGSLNGLNVEGFENFVTEKHTFEKGKRIEDKFFSLQSSENNPNELLIKTITIQYNYDESGEYTGSTTSVTTETATPDLKKPENRDTHQPGEFD